MSRYKLRVVEYRDMEVDPDELVSVAEAAEITGMSMPGVIRAIERGALSEVIDSEKDYHGRRLLLRKEVEKMARERKKG